MMLWLPGPQVIRAPYPNPTRCRLGIFALSVSNVPGSRKMTSSAATACTQLVAQGKTETEVQLFCFASKEMKVQQVLNGTERRRFVPPNWSLNFARDTRCRGWGRITRTHFTALIKLTFHILDLPLPLIKRNQNPRGWAPPQSS